MLQQQYEQRKFPPYLNLHGSGMDILITVMSWLRHDPTYGFCSYPAIMHAGNEDTYANVGAHDAAGNAILIFLVVIVLGYVRNLRIKDFTCLSFALISFSWKS